MDKTKMDPYELMRKKIDLLKEKDGFKCFRCGSCCHGPSNPITGLDVEYQWSKSLLVEVRDHLQDIRNFFDNYS